MNKVNKLGLLAFIIGVALTSKAYSEISVIIGVTAIIIGIIAFVFYKDEYE